MKHKIEINFPQDYNYPYFTSEMVADILKQNPRTIRKKRRIFATEVTPGNYLWSEENILNLIAAPINAGNPNLKKKEDLKC